MPVLQPDYHPPNPLFRNGHFSTIYPNRFRRVQLNQPFQRHRINTPDGDFIDVELSACTHHRTAILLHGFEGNANRPYMMGMANHLMDHGWDIVAMNLRGCSGEPNLTTRAYHAGEIGDLATVVDYALKSGACTSLALVGFSLGGNIVLNYLARSRDIPVEMRAAVAVSVPIDLRTAVFEIMKFQNWVYHREFHSKIIHKMKEKERTYPDLLPYADILRSRNIDEIDENYTAPFHGFRDASDYRNQSSSLFVLDQIKRPALLLNARNDPFLSSTAYPYDLAKSSELFHLLTPQYGGHCGFWMKKGAYFHERMASRFLNEIIHIGSPGF